MNGKQWCNGFEIMMDWACGTRMCALPASALWTLCVSEENLTHIPLLFFSARNISSAKPGPPHSGTLFCILQQFCFPALFPSIFTPHSKIGRTLMWVCCCYLVAVSEFPIMACLNSRKCTLQQRGAVAYGQSTVAITLSQ